MPLLRSRANDDCDAIVVRPRCFLDARGREVREGVADLVTRAGGMRAVRGERLIDEHDHRIFGEERGSAGA